VAVLNGTNGALEESFTRGVGLAGDVGTLVAVRYYTGYGSNETHYLHANHRGDVILARYGTIGRAGYEYMAFGREWSWAWTKNARFKFSSKEYDASVRMYNYGARFYFPEWQRWPNRDLIGEAGGINLYVFCDNNSINLIDVVGFGPGELYPRLDTAAIAAINEVNPVSVRRNREFGGYLYLTNNRCFTYGPQKMELKYRDRVFFGPPNKAYGTLVGIYHTHGAGSEDFSHGDINLAKEQGKKLGGYFTIYVGTPSGAIKRYYSRYPASVIDTIQDPTPLNQLRIPKPIKWK
jgi:RHS repeat-associated protein